VPADLQDRHKLAHRPSALKTVVLPQMQPPQDNSAAEMTDVLLRMQ